MTVAKARLENEETELYRRGSHTFSFLPHSEIQTLERTVSSAPPTTLNLGSQNASCPSSKADSSSADPHSVVGWTLLSLGTHTEHRRAVKKYILKKRLKILSGALSALLDLISSPLLQPPPDNDKCLDLRGGSDPESNQSSSHPPPQSHNKLKSRPPVQFDQPNR